MQKFFYSRKLIKISENIRNTSDANEKSIDLIVQSLTGKQDNIKDDLISYFAVNCLINTNNL